MCNGRTKNRTGPVKNLQSTRVICSYRVGFLNFTPAKRFLPGIQTVLHLQSLNRLFSSAGRVYGSIAQLVQSICLTSRGSGVRIPLLPLIISHLHRDVAYIFSSGYSRRNSSQYSLTEFFMSFLSARMPKRFGTVIRAIVMPDNVHTIVVSVNDATKKPIT